MTIGFYNVTPAPLAGVLDLHTNIWEKECTFEPRKQYNIVAPSGKGKSTFLHCIYGLRFDYTGKVQINERDVKKLTHNQWAELRQDQISMVYQDLRLFLHLTALENLQVKSALYAGDFNEKITNMAATLNVTHVLNKKCKTLSYGERQRIAIIRSLIQPFNWLLLDEPFSHLDKDNSIKAATLIRTELEQRNSGLIITALSRNDYFAYDRELQL